MRHVVAALITFGILALIGMFLRWGANTENYWVFAVVIAGSLILAVLVANDEDRQDARERWHRLTSFFRQ